MSGDFDILEVIVKSCQSWTSYPWLQLTESRYSNKLKKPFSSFPKDLTTFFEKKWPTESVSGSWQLWCSVLHNLATML